MINDVKGTSIYCQNLKNICEKLLDSQLSMETVYNNMSQWQDDVYVKVGNILYKISSNIDLVYSNIKEKVIELNDIAEKMAKGYLNTRYDSISTIKNFSINIRRDSTMSKETSYNVTSRQLEKFSTAVKEYCSQVDKTSQKLRGEHENARSFWKDEHYTRFTRIIEDFQSEFKRQTKELNILIEDIDKKSKTVKMIEEETLKRFLKGSN